VKKKRRGEGEPFALKLLSTLIPFHHERRRKKSLQEKGRKKERLLLCLSSLPLARLAPWTGEGGGEREEILEKKRKGKLRLPVRHDILLPDAVQAEKRERRKKKEKNSSGGGGGSASFSLVTGIPVPDEKGGGGGEGERKGEGRPSSPRDYSLPRLRGTPKGEKKKKEPEPRRRKKRIARGRRVNYFNCFLLIGDHGKGKTSRKEKKGKKVINRHLS